MYYGQLENSQLSTVQSRTLRNNKRISLDIDVKSYVYLNYIFVRKF